MVWHLFNQFSQSCCQLLNIISWINSSITWNLQGCNSKRKEDTKYVKWIIFSIFHDPTKAIYPKSSKKELSYLGKHNWMWVLYLAYFEPKKISKKKNRICTGCKSIFRKIFEFKIWKKPMLVLKQTILHKKALILSFSESDSLRVWHDQEGTLPTWRKKNVLLIFHMGAEGFFTSCFQSKETTLKVHTLLGCCS